MKPAYQVRGRVVQANDEPCKSGGVGLKRDGERSARTYGPIEDDEVVIEGVLPGTYEVSVNCKGALAQENYDDIVVVDADIEGMVWTTEVAAVLEGDVRNEEGEPITTAMIQVQGEPGSDPRARVPSAWEEADDDGHFKATTAPGVAKVSAQAPGYMKSEAIEVELETGKTTATKIVMSSGGTIEGVVVDEDGQPVKGAQVHSTNPKKPFDWNMFSGGRTADDGQFVLKGLAPGTYRVSVNDMRAPGKTDDDVQGKKVEVTSGGTSKVKLVVESQKETIVGQVLSNGEPLGDAYVSATRESDRAGAQPGGGWRNFWGEDKPVLTDMEGRFTIKNLSKGKYTVKAYRKGGGSIVQESVVAGSEVTLEIKDTGSIAGKVVGKKVPPVFSIAVLDAKAGFSRQERFVGTEGEFAMMDLPPGDYTVSVQTGMGRASEEVELKSGEEKRDLELKLEELATVSGRVVDMDTGEPVPGIQMMATPEGDMQSGTFMMGGNKDKLNVTGKDGTFTIRKAPTGNLNLVGFSTDWENTEYNFIMQPLPGVSSGEDRDVGDVRIAKKKLKKGEVAGDLGFTMKEPAKGAKLTDYQMEVALIFPDGPAADSGLEVGDVITSVNGNDVTKDIASAWAHMQAPEGTTLKFGLERGETVEITLGPPRG
jgi:protocatechuate 3,4-dioxygenase beta subunit